jgi:hypothetical protein
MNKKRFNERSKRFSFGQQPVKAEPDPLFERIWEKLRDPSFKYKDGTCGLFPQTLSDL